MCLLPDRRTDMKTKYPSQVVDQIFQVDHINPFKISFFEAVRDDPAIVRLFKVLIRHLNLKMVLDENKSNGNQNLVRSKNSFTLSKCLTLR